jgi:hypothetical protein
MAFWAVGEPNASYYNSLHSMIAGFKWSIVDYSRKIEELFAKMEGVRSVVLPPNLEAIDRYFESVWVPVHSLTAPMLSESSESSESYVPDDIKKFNSYLEAEEARLGRKLGKVNYIIDEIDTIPVIAGIGRIEKVRIQQYLLHLS